MFVSPGVTQLRIHQRTHTFRTYQCDLCSKTYGSLTGLQSHRATHTAESRFLCSQCGKRFKTRDGLEGHLRTHTGERPYRCPYCSKDFTALAGLNVHVRRHTGERPYVCTVCGKGWPSGGDLQKHMRTHTGERPYVCQDCGKAFSISCHLTEHRRIHTGKTGSWSHDHGTQRYAVVTPDAFVPVLNPSASRSVFQERSRSRVRSAGNVYGGSLTWRNTCCPTATSVPTPAPSAPRATPEKLTWTDTCSHTRLPTARWWWCRWSRNPEDVLKSELCALYEFHAFIPAVSESIADSRVWVDLWWCSLRWEQVICVDLIYRQN